MSILEDTYQYLNWEFLGPCFIAVRIFQGMGFSERPNMRVIQEDIAPPNALDRADRCSKKKLYVFFFLSFFWSNIGDSWSSRNSLPSFWSYWKGFRTRKSTFDNCRFWCPPFPTIRPLTGWRCFCQTCCCRTGRANNNSSMDLMFSNRGNMENPVCICIYRFMYFLCIYIYRYVQNLRTYICSMYARLYI